MMQVASPSVLDARPEQSASPADLRGRWLNLVTHLDPKYGGLSAVLPELCSAVAATSRLDLSLTGFCLPGEQYEPRIDPSIQLNYLPLSRAAWFQDGHLRRRFDDMVEDADGLHLHGLWQQTSAVGARAARRHNKPYVLSAHGMLDRWALANKGLKKKIYSALIEAPNVRGAACLHALTRTEAEDYRRFGARGPIAVIPNGVTIPDRVSPIEFLTRFPQLAGKRLVLFLGRIHFKKGLDILVEAWSKVSAHYPDAHLVLSGPDFENTAAQVEQRIAAHSLSQRVTLTGMVSGNLKWSAFAAAEVFTLPSYSEGLSVSVLEAMGMRLPVIITEQCNLPEVAEASAGWAIEPHADQLEAALHECLGATSAQRRELGERGSALVAERFTWPVVGAQMASVYAWAQGSAPAPSCVEEYSR